MSAFRDHARVIWQAGVDAVRPKELVRRAIAMPELGLTKALVDSRNIIVVGGGKAGAGMCRGLESGLSAYVDRVHGVVNVPAESVCPLQAIQLNASRPRGTNEPTAEGVAGSEEMLRLMRESKKDDVAICLLSGGASALMPAPVPGVSLADKQQVTRALHACGATINEMNTVRKHLSRIKGGRLAAAFTGKALYSLIISDVIGDPLEVIGSGPTVVDSTTFADALAVFGKYQLAHPDVPATVIQYLEEGRAGNHPETPKRLAANVHNLIIGNNQMALAGAERRAAKLGYVVERLETPLQGDTAAAVEDLAAAIREMQVKREPASAPLCLLAGGETTVALKPNHGLGGRNQQLALALLMGLEKRKVHHAVIFCAGTDGEDGPTDAAGAVGDDTTFTKAAQLGLDPNDYLRRQDAYHFFRQIGDLVVTGLTGTNVMDLCIVILT
jgi:hydroxypyruvate reductase/glycerate 2-kinase